MANIKKLFESKIGSILISIILGLGLAALFRSACKDGKCIVIEGPPRQDTDKYYYKFDNSCYKYTPVATECDK